MTPAPALIAAWRQALVNIIDVEGPGVLALYAETLTPDGVAPSSSPLVSIQLAYPVGAVDEAGVSLSATEYAQVEQSGDVISARIHNALGAWCGDFTVGLATDDPIPELILPVRTFRAGAFVRLAGARIDIG